MSETKLRFLLLGGGLSAFVLLMSLEILTEEDALSLGDLLVDALVMFLTIMAAASVAALFARMERERVERAALLDELQTAKLDGASWRARVETHVNGMRSAIHEQFNAWSMTPAECDVALLILKGLSHKEIAILRKTAETTVRQQAQAVYRKSGLSGKNALAAYFLEDLLDSAPAAPDRAGNGGAVQDILHP